MLEYSLNSLPARVLLHGNANDVIFVTEDISQIKFHTAILRRILGKGKKLRSTFPVGNRKSVIQAAGLWLQGFSKPTIFLIDGDLFLLTEKNEQLTENIIRLPFCNIENSIFCQRSAVRIAAESNLHHDYKNCREILSLKSYIGNSLDLLIPLIAGYAIAFESNLSIKTTSLDVRAFMSGDCISAQNLQTKIQEIRDALCQTRSPEEIDRRFSHYQNILNENKMAPLRFFPGKTYLLPLLQMRLASCLNFKDSGLLMRLATKSQNRLIAELRQMISQRLKTIGP